MHKSKAYIPRRFYQLELTGAGFKNVTMTPLQAALVAGSAVNGGKIVKPYIIKEIISSSGKVVYIHKDANTLSAPITAKTAHILKQLMITTVTKGVAHADFYNSAGRYMLPGVIAGGKTGTISGNNPQGLYQWFAGFGEMNGKKIALSALVIENPVWKIEGGGVAEKVFLAYFF
jgi:cell division protein FtsI/penicillin-binding protein 2